MTDTTSPITTVECVLKGLMAAAGSDAIRTANIFHFRRTTTVNALSKANINTAFQTSISAPVAAALNARWGATVNSIRFPNDALDAPVDFANTDVGAISGDSMPSMNAAYILFRTGIRGKSYRGSKHFGPMSESDSTTTSDVFNSACLARLATINTAILAGFTDSDGNVWTPAVLSTSLSQLRANPTIVVVNYITAGLVNHRIGRLRRRETASVY